MSDASDKPLRDDVHLLGDLLGQTLCAQEGEPLFAMVERVRALAKSGRAGDAVKYRVIKNVRSKDRSQRTAAFVRDAAADPLRALFFAPQRNEPFAVLHSLAEEGL